MGNCCYYQLFTRQTETGFRLFKIKKPAIMVDTGL